MRKHVVAVLAALGALAATDASAQVMNLSGPYRVRCRLRRNGASSSHAVRLGPQSRERSWHTLSRLG